ncbi:MAG TPA: DHH family phosphoesterase, partial [Tepidisphaeraceae bacterium]|nr:DHH family phosphoesterase [Tepidisphaeraceae bacterium]
MHRPKRWNIVPPAPAAAELAAALRCSPLLAQVLLNRGISDAATAGEFLRPTPKLMADPALIPGLPRAAERIAQAIRDKQKIVVYGDYDVDGITATSILWHAIRQLGGEIDYYIPHRVEEGYGLNAEALAQICADGAGLIVSVDCGITAVEQAKVCKERGVDLIITDHHEWHSVRKDEGGRMKDEADGADGASAHPSSFILHPLLPDCHTIVHPRLPGSTYPNPHLCGAGVAFKLAWGVGLAMNGGSDKVSAEFRAFLVEATALAALGTIADVVPLVGENRVIAHWGLGGLKQSKLHGIQALIASANLVGQKLDAYHVGFLLAPRLNACGRMGHAREAVEMLTKADPARATEIAVYLEAKNKERQGIERKILDQAVAQAKELGCDRDECRAIVLGGEDWHAGVIGIVASRIVDRFHRPAVMIAMTNGHGQGSARSIPGFHLARALESCREHLDAFGGHEMAAGLKIQTPKLADFRAAFCHHAAGVLEERHLTPELRLECLADLKFVTEALVKDLKRVGPFGHANPKPLLCCQGLTLAAPPRRVGKTGDHLQLQVTQGDLSIKCIAFNTAHLLERLKTGTVLNLAVEP